MGEATSPQLLLRSPGGGLDRDTWDGQDLQVDPEGVDWKAQSPSLDTLHTPSPNIPEKPRDVCQKALVPTCLACFGLMYLPKCLWPR